MGKLGEHQCWVLGWARACCEENWLWRGWEGEAVFLQMSSLMFSSGRGQGTGMLLVAAAVISQSCLLCRSSSAKRAGEPAKSS